MISILLTSTVKTKKDNFSSTFVAPCGDFNGYSLYSPVNSVTPKASTN